MRLKRKPVKDPVAVIMAKLDKLVKSLSEADRIRLFEALAKNMTAPSTEFEGAESEDGKSNQQP